MPEYFDRLPLADQLRAYEQRTGQRMRISVARVLGYFQRAGLYACNEPPRLRDARELMEVVSDWTTYVTRPENIAAHFYGTSEYFHLNNTLAQTARYGANQARRAIQSAGNGSHPLPVHQFDRYLDSFTSALPYLVRLNQEPPPRTPISRQAIYDGIIRTLRAGKNDLLAWLRRTTAEAAGSSPEARVAFDALITAVDGVSELLLRFLLAVTGMVGGVLSGLLGLVEGIWGLIVIVVQLMELVFALVLRELGVNRRQMDHAIDQNLEAFAQIPDAFAAAIRDWDARFWQASQDQQTVMIGEIVGELLVVLGTLGAGTSATATRGATFTFSMEVRASRLAVLTDGRTVAIPTTRTLAVPIQGSIPASLTLANASLMMRSGGGGGDGGGAPPSGGGSPGNFRRRSSRPPELIRATDEFIATLELRGTPRQLDRLTNELENLYNRVGESSYEFATHRLGNIQRFVQRFRRKLRRTGRGDELDIDSVTSLVQLERRGYHASGTPPGQFSSIQGARTELRNLTADLENIAVERMKLVPDPPASYQAPDAVLWYARDRRPSWVTGTHERIDYFAHRPTGALTPQSVSNAFANKITNGQLDVYIPESGLRGIAREGSLIMEVETALHTTQPAVAQAALPNLADEALLLLRRRGVLQQHRGVRRLVIKDQSSGRRLTATRGGSGRSFFPRFEVDGG